MASPLRPKPQPAGFRVLKTVGHEVQRKLRFLFDAIIFRPLALAEDLSRDFSLVFFIVRREKKNDELSR